MARHWASGATDIDVLDNTSSAPSNAYPYAFSVWVKHSDAGDFRNIIFESAITNNNNRQGFGFQTTNDKQFSTETIASTGTNYFSTNNDWDPAQWNHHFYAWRGTADRKTYYNGTLVQDDTTERGGPPTAPNQLAFGRGWTSGSNFNDGEVAEVGWILAGSASDLDGMELQLADGAPIRQVAGALLAHYWEMNGAASAGEIDRVGGINLTLGGTVTKVAHPPQVWRPDYKTIFVPAGGAPPAVAPNFLSLLGVG